MHDQATRMREIAREYKEREEHRRPCVIVVTSGKGGVGKSTVALNAALTLSDEGHKVMLIDADSNLGSLDVMLGIAPRYRMGDVLRGNMSVEDVLVTAFSGLKVLPASSGDASYPLGREEMQERFMAEVFGTDELFECVIIDTGAGLNDEVIGYTSYADEVLVVTNPEPTAVMDAYAMMKVIWSVRGDASLRVILNNAHSPREGQEVAAKLGIAVAHFLKRDIEVAAVIPSDPNVPKAVAQQVPLVKAYPHSAASLSIQAFAYHTLLQIMGRSERKAI